MPLVKICGITKLEELDWVIDAGADFAGIVQFFPKSRRNVSIDTAEALVKHGAGRIKMVAVTVLPTIEQIRVLEKIGFDIVQIHGSVDDKVLDNCVLPVLKAFNVGDLPEYERYHSNPNVMGYVFDSQLPGSGKGFDWSLLDAVPRDDKITLLAGGLYCENVVQAVARSGVSGVDTSTGVENDNGIGKNKKKIYDFVRLVKSKKNEVF
ncbi:MAG: phosphoribosylanthranilate isomerase [Wujia sp.]